MLGCDALFSFRADFSFWLGATSCRVVLARLGSGERMTNTMADRQRREFLQLAVGGALAASLAPSDSTPVAAEPLGQPVPFSTDTVLKMATELASKPFKAPETPALPSVFSGLTFEQYAAIRRVPGTAIWSDQKLGFSLEPLHRGFVYTTPIGINIVENGMAEKVIYDAADFDFGSLKPPAPLGDLGFSGLRILKSSDQGFEDVVIFQGATFYRAKAHSPALRPHRTRPGNSDRRRPGRRISAVPRVLDRKAQSGGEYAHRSGLARFCQRHRRLSLYDPSCGHHHHRHRDDADRTDGGRQTGARGYGRSLSFQPARSSASRRRARGSL